jgi:hypothetical protein
MGGAKGRQELHVPLSRIFVQERGENINDTGYLRQSCFQDP